MKKRTLFLACIICVLLPFFTGCESSKNNNRVVIWTDCSEFAQYIELFNKTHKDNRAVLVYKENPALSLPPAKDEPRPDIIVGSWLRNDKTTRYFKQLDSIFDRKTISVDEFYPLLLKAGEIRKTQYLLPVSFNLPAIIFSTKNHELVEDNYTLSLDEIRRIGSEYNKKNKTGAYTRIGFTPLSNSGFLYLVTKLNGVDLREEKQKIIWNQEKLEQSVNYMRDWISTENTSAQVEEDFAFKYLFMPYYRQVASDRTLFAYTTSDQLFKTMNELELELEYRWICMDDQIPIEDDFTMLGIYKKAENLVGAIEFITWFFQSESQQQILNRKAEMALETDLFGIAGGFSAVRDVNEHILPTYYTQLLSNLPPSQMLKVPQKLPVRWESYKTSVVEAYLNTAVVAEDVSAVPGIESFEKEWLKKLFDQ